jgi:hypothetical protein
MWKLCDQMISAEITHAQCNVPSLPCALRRTSLDEIEVTTMLERDNEGQCERMIDHEPTTSRGKCDRSSQTIYSSG